jgi:hypothetical protein
MDDLIKQLKSEGINQKSPSKDWDTKMQGLKVKLEKEKRAEKPKIPTRWFSISKAFSDTVLTTAVVSLGNSFELPVLFKRIGWRLVAASFVRGAKLSSRLKVLGIYSAHILRIRKHHGAIHCVTYLKACQLALQKAIARSPVTSLKEITGEGPFPRLDRRGLPRIIPYRDRCLIMRGGFSVIRL